MYNLKTPYIMCSRLFLIILRNLSLSLAGRTFLPRKSAPVLASLECRILIPRQHHPADLGTFHRYPSMNVESLIRCVSRSLAVRTSRHPYILTTAGTVITAVSRTYRTTHTRASLLNDQHQYPAQANAIHPATSSRSQLIMLITRSPRLINPNNPANTVRKMHPANPIALTITFSILLAVFIIFCLYLVSISILLVSAISLARRASISFT